MLGNSRLDQIGADVQQAFITRISPKVARKTLADASVFTAKNQSQRSSLLKLSVSKKPKKLFGWSAL
jgi:hypothetical protein